MKTRLKKYLNKHKNRIFSLIAVMVFIPMFSFNAFAYTEQYLTYPYYKVEMNVASSFNEMISSAPEIATSYNNIYKYTWDNSNPYSYSSFFIGNRFHNFVYPYDSERYDYKVVGYTSWNPATPSYMSTFSTVDLSSITIYETLSNLSYREFVPSNLVIDKGYNDDSVYWTFSFDLDDYSDLTFFRLDYSPSAQFTNRTSLDFQFTAQVVAIPKDTSAEQVQGIIAAINNQTSALGGKIDNTNDFINFGNGSTSGIVSDNNSAIDNLDEVVSEYHATEQQFFDDFTANQQAINSDIVGWSWGGLVNCANWVGETMTDYYNNMGDFRQYIIYPLMLGIVLFFLGRGGAIIGHLFRKPTQSTVNIESTSFKRGNTRYTTTTTSKKGGVFRK